MDRLRQRRNLRRLVVLALMLVLAAGASPRISAQQPRLLKGFATGAITFLEPCGVGFIGQHSFVSGQATQLGRFTGVLFECVDPLNGTYTGTGTFTASNGDTFTSTSIGQAIPGQNGLVAFFEHHTIHGGTGRFLDATGGVDVAGTVDAVGHIQIVALGTIAT